MSVYFVGTDISKYKYDSCIMSATDLAVVTKFTIKMISLDLSNSLQFYFLSPSLKT